MTDTESLTTEQALCAALDADPSDAFTRSAYADWLEENGRCEEAAGQRWLLRQEMHPAFDSQWIDTGSVWDWWPVSYANKPAGSIWHFGSFDELFKGGCYATRAEAEADAIAFAVRHGLIETEPKPQEGGVPS